MNEISKLNFDDISMKPLYPECPKKRAKNMPDAMTIKKMKIDECNILVREKNYFNVSANLVISK